ncbi:MAG: hypothetical protein ACLRO4_07755 [Lachnospiraceae bacterium]|nr:MAG: hypothetical protein [Bacteriophage sp.]
MRRKRRKKKNSLLFGEKVMGAGFMTVLIFGCGLDGPNWILPLIMVGIGMAVMEVGSVIAKAEGSEYV